MTERLAGLLTRLDGILSRVEDLLGAPAGQAPGNGTMFDAHWAFRWESRGRTGRIVPVPHPDLVDLSDLVGIDDVKEELLRNTAQFVAGHPANNVLVWGERGNGKSSCIKGLLNVFGPRGLRIVEVQRWDLLSLPGILAALRASPRRFVLFCDDLSFGEGEVRFRELKTLLDGGLEARPENVLIYATSNRRHLMPEPMADNTGETEIHPEEAVSEKLSLSDRFGLTLGIPKFGQHTYLAIVDHYAARMNVACPPDLLHAEAHRWALDNGRRTGRTARQFVSDLAGRLRMAGQ
ncbi:MAG: ATP-binding protein [Actinomycetota bacterium]